ncbi:MULTISPECIES: TonB-dependent siderophore receptor [Sphingobium]|jgi:outer membrane receptor for ferric coprogen and ferric-rhodotorulic acid|uniref:TonB-dependent siderophore receptor n=1 Tax=Sphingobium TaxID=165695 RepID=UPI000E72D6FD|nr:MULTISPECIES: TonB-dependent siderophore receptor [Sphingobium]KAA9013659.1 TonB-dependent siderophore receptor [Sphingobium limneticum]MBU0931343.1 TonB-dependent siderophore receptor [Alphaproteobacteria bacterium]
MIRKFSLLLSASVAAFAAMPAAAQAPAAAAAPAEDEIVVTGTYTLPNKIDTATGLGLTVQETPQSVSIMTAQRILDQNLISIKDVITNSVGVSANEVDDVRNNFYARGFEIRNTQVDGVPAAWTLSGGNGETSIDVSIYERIEVVRGATGLLSGAGDPSASVNLVRKHADATDLTGYVNASIGSWNTWRVSADVGGALTADGRIRARVVGRYEEGESYIDLQKKKKWVLYGVVDADVTDTTLIRAGISHQDSKPKGATWGALPTFYTDGTTTDLPRSQSTAADWTHWNTTNQNIFATIRQEIGDKWNLTVNYNRLRTTNSSELLYLYGNVDKATGTIEFSNPYKAEGISIQNSFDAQLKGEVSLFGRDHEVVVGALHSVLKRHTDNYVAPFPWATNVPVIGEGGADFPEPTWSTVATRNEQERIEQTGYYGAFRLNVADPFKIILGGRLSSWNQKGFAWTGPSDYGDDNVFIPYVGALYDVTSNHRVYASFTKIFQPQNLYDRNLNLLDPLDGNAYEIGLKSNFFDNALQTSVALFRIEQDNVGQIGEIITTPSGPQQTYVAAQGVTSKGFEIEATGQPLPGWNLNASYSQFKAEDGDGVAANTVQPRKLLKIFTTYDLPGVLTGLTVGGGINFRSKAYSEGLNPVTAAPFRFQQDGYTLVNLMARYAVTEQLQIQGNIENLFDKKYYSQMGFFSQYRYGAPRNFTISANYKF